MLRDILKHLRGGSGEGESPAEALSTALLLIELARADFDFDDSEHDAIVASLAQRYALTRADAERLLQEARDHAREVVSLYDYVKSLNVSLDGSGKRWLMETLWRVAHADGRVDKYEEQLLRKLAGLLFISEDDYVRAKLAAAGEGE